MKHLLRYKLFESVEKLYEPISADEFHSSFDEDNLSNYTEFTRDELFDMRNYFDNLDYDSATQGHLLDSQRVKAVVKQSHCLVKNPVTKKTTYQPFVRVVKFSDDWFFVEISYNYFKCDTFEGVIQLFKDWTQGKISKIIPD